MIRFADSFVHLALSSALNLRFQTIIMINPHIHHYKKLSICGTVIDPKPWFTECVKWPWFKTVQNRDLRGAQITFYMFRFNVSLSQLWLWDLWRLIVCKVCKMYLSWEQLVSCSNLARLFPRWCVLQDLIWKWFVLHDLI